MSAERMVNHRTATIRAQQGFRLEVEQTVSGWRFTDGKGATFAQVPTSEAALHWLDGFDSGVGFEAERAAKIRKFAEED